MSSSTNGINTGGINVATFSGSSTYASSFQQVLTRAVGLASLPVQQMEVDVNTLNGQQSALSGLDTTFAQLQNALQAVDAAQVSVAATSSNTSIVTASATSSALPGVYSVSVSNLGSQATALSSAGTPPVTDPTTQNIDASTSYTLSVNSSTTTITPTGTSLNDLANAINAANAGVEATVVNVGGSSGADYRLALTDTNMGANTLQLTDSGNHTLLSQIAPGSSVQYSVNGSSTINSNTRSVTVAPGLTANLVNTGTVTIDVGANDAGLGQALSSFAQAYNAAVTAVQQQTGQNNGAVEGQSIVFTMQSVLSGISQYAAGTGSVSTLAQLGLQVDSNGQMSFDATAFNSLHPADLQTFLGGLTSGGFLQAANSSVDSLTNQTTGAFQTSIQSIQKSVDSENAQITEKVAAVNQMQSDLLQRLSAADAAIATLQSQVNFFTALFQTENASAFSKA
jgi:flagellar hook-associated protein 2